MPTAQMRSYKEIMIAVNTQNVNKYFSGTPMSFSILVSVVQQVVMDI